MIRTRSILIALILIIASISISYADITVTPPAGSVSLPSINSDNPGTAIASIISWMIGLTAILTVLAITWSGIQMIFATGEDEKFKKARYIMIYAFIGLLIAGLAYAAVNFITNLDLNTLI